MISIKHICIGVVLGLLVGISVSTSQLVLMESEAAVVEPKFDGFMASTKDDTKKGLALAINGLVKKGFVIRQVNVMSYDIIILVDKKCTPEDAVKAAEKIKAVDHIEPNWIITLDPLR